MTTFLKEINQLNASLSSRKNQIRQRILKLNKELEALMQCKRIPAQIVQSIITQRNVVELVKNALENGSTTMDTDSVPAIQKMKEILQDLEDSSNSDKNGFNFEPVFRTEKTQGYRKEMERSYQKKREEKSDYKASNNFPFLGSEDPFGSFEAPLDELYNPISAYPYHEKSSYEKENSKPGRLDQYEPLYKDNLPGMPSFRDEGHAADGPRFMAQNSYKNLVENSNKMSNKHEKHQDLDFNELPHGEELPVFETLDNKKDSNPFPTPKIPVKKEIDEELDLFGEFADPLKDTTKLHETAKFKGVDDDLFAEDPFKDESFDEDEDSDTDNDDSREDEDSSYDKINSNFTKNHPEMVGKDMHDGQNAAYMQQMMYMESPEAMGGHMYPQSPYMLDPAMYGDMYGAPSHQMLGMNYIKSEQDLGGYMPMQHGIDYRYYDHQKALKHTKMEGRSNRGRKRQKYKMLPTDLKRKAVDLARYKTPKFSANFYGVPLKSLKRWMKVGCERKKGGGRKTKDPIMEKNLYAWYIDMKTRGETVTAKMIKDKAIALTNCSDFIASKGWLDKFKVRFNLEISKESNKDTLKKRPYPENPKKRTHTSKMSYPDEDTFYGMNLDGFKSVRRSITKNVKQESEDKMSKFLAGSDSATNANSESVHSKQHPTIKPNKGSIGSMLSTGMKQKSQLASIFVNNPSENPSA